MEYVICDCRQWTELNKVLVVEKHRPAWQKGRLNLVGGKIEPAETPEQAVIRELQEETGFTDIQDVREMGRIVDHSEVIHCMFAYLASGSEIRPRECETERPQWVLWSSLQEDPRLIPNLRVIIPLMRSGVHFEIHDDYRSRNGETHSFQLTVPDPRGQDASQDQQL